MPARRHRGDADRLCDRPRVLAKLRDQPPKPFIGYSDITVFHALFGKELNWATFYGPVLTGFAKATEYTLASFRDALMRAEPFDILPNPDDAYVETITPGVVEASWSAAACRCSTGR